MGTHRTQVHLTWLFVFCISLALFLAAVQGQSNARVASPNESNQAQWIWSPEHEPGNIPQATCYFRKTIHLPASYGAVLRVAGDDVFEVFLNGKLAGQGSGASRYQTFDVSALLREGKNVIAAKVVNRNGQTAGLAAELVASSASGDIRQYLTNPTWRTNLRPLPLWDALNYRDNRWKAARNLGEFGSATPGSPGAEMAAGQSQVAATALPSREKVTRAHGVGEDAPPNLAPSNLAPSNRAKSNRAKSNDAESNDAIETRRTAAPAKTNESANRSANNDRGSDDPATPPLARFPAAPPITYGEFPEFSVRPGFEIQHVAGHEEIGSAIAMAFNEFGQLLVAQEDGPLLMIYDSNDNGSLDQVRICCHQVSNCHGILSISGKVYVIGEGSAGAALYRLEDRDRDGTMEDVEPLVKFQGNLGDAGPHGLALGPDGLIYVALGNQSRVNQPYSLTSPYQNPYEGELVPRYEDPQGDPVGVAAPGGGVLRVDIGGNRVELFAAGQRNAYDLAFNEAGELFMHDCDMESDRGAPWHVPARVLHVTSAGEYGWRSGWSKWPDYWIDGLPAMMETGHGSPAGCTFYDHTAFPARYHDSLFSVDWAQGEINTYRFDRRGAGYSVHRELFLTGKPLNIKDVDVGPDGWLYFCTGGRGTQGSIYRVVYGQAETAASASGKLSLEAAIEHPGMNTAWGRQAVSTMRREMSTTWDHAIRHFIADRDQSPRLRARAMQIMHLLGPPPSDVELLDWSLDPDSTIRAKSAYLLGLVGNEATSMRLVEMLRDDVSHVRRHACEGLARTGQQVALNDLRSMLVSPDRVEATAARRLLEKNETGDWQGQVMASDDIRLFLQGATAILVAAPTRQKSLDVVAKCESFCDAFVSDTNFVDLLRVLELAIERGELSADDVPRLAARLTREFPAGNTHINRELARLLVFLQASSATDRMLAYLDSEVAQEEKIHVATQLRFMERGWSGEQRLKLLGFFETLDTGKRDHSLGGYVDAIVRDIAVSMTPAERALVLENGQRLPRAAVATLFALSEEDDRANFERFRRLDYYISDLKGDDYDRLKIGLVAVMARGGDDLHMAYLREAYDRSPERRTAIAMGLAQRPEERNWDYLVRSLPLLEGDAAVEVITKLQTVDYAPEEEEHFRQLILCGLRLKNRGGLEASRLLRHWAGGGGPSAELGGSWHSQLSAWQAWYEGKNPDQPVARLPIESGHNTWTFHDLTTYLSSGEGAKGSVDLGRAVFEKAQCANCHRHGGIGNDYAPNLTAISSRFQTREILESIIYPSQVIAENFESHTLVTKQSLKIGGLLVPRDDGQVQVIKNDGTSSTVPELDVVDVLANKNSAMPEGLLNQLSLQEIADLFAFLAVPEQNVARENASAPPTTR